MSSKEYFQPPLEPKRRGCLPRWIAALFSASAPAAEPGEGLPYRKRDSLLTKAELSFFAALRQSAGESVLFAPKVRVADLLFLPKGTEERQKHLNRILAKHVDFVLCDRATLEPLLAIELDDSSHDRPDRLGRDAFLDDALRAAGLPLLRVRAARSYAPNELRGEIERAFAVPSRE